MSTVTISPGALVTKDPSDIKVYVFDWDTNNLAVGVTISGVPVWTITAVKPSTTDTNLTKDNESVLAGSRKTQVRLLGGTVGQTYEIANKIVTNETPAQTKERSFRVLIQDR
jgi:hypothetical protein